MAQVTLSFATAWLASKTSEVGLPNSVLNFIHTSTPARTAEIIAHPAVRKINFTGSDRVGKIIAMEAGMYLKRCVFEPGGKVLVRALVHSGQICMSTVRVIAQHKRSERPRTALLAQFREDDAFTDAWLVVIHPANPPPYPLVDF
ncbi:ALDH-like protein [Daedalea quercina L-15889]|uniref:ALDH-like protein n=1 Tax=Daedalea quercina L-15889 TaxID=1314783 RepID=A0A165SNE8_9APHY|nr:ALDH-like protein [Daedalea quercina L-15889]